MADVGLRDLGSFVPGGRRTEAEPVAAAVTPRADRAPSVLITPPPSAAKPRVVFGGDLPAGADALGVEDTLATIAELAAHRGTATPLCVGLVGGPGTGKSFALGTLTARICDLATAAGAAGQGPFLSRIHVQPIDAASLDGDPTLGLAARLHAGLRQPYPDLAREIGHTARDPHVVLREVNEKLDDARRRLDSERRALDDAGSRRARLTETVLYEAAGSQVDAYARANRGGIESRLNGFGITGDPIRNYKDLVQVVAGSGKVGLASRSLWGFKGQTKLIVAAVVLVAIGVGLGAAIDDQTNWLATIRAAGKAGPSIADWSEAHVGLLGSLRGGAFVLAALAILANLWRAFAFLTPIFKGVRLLDGDLDARRRDLDGLYAHQTKRVDTLDADVERLTRESAEAERRVGYTGPATLNEPSPFEAAGPPQAQSFFAVLARMLAQPRGSAPQRIVLALDHLDAVSPARARAILDALHRAAAGSLVALVAVDPTRLGASGAGDLERWIQVPVRLDDNERDYGALVEATLGQGAPAASAKLDARASRLDSPVDGDETTLLSSLAALAGPSPRAIKRFVNLYTLARLDGDGHRGALMLMLALALGGTGEDRAAVAAAFARGDQAASFDLPTADALLRGALAAVVAVDGPFNLAEARKAARRAARFSL